ncbi:MAG: transposase [Candidatus Omnitrophica bacterium]|nr:transposase [Candidatus Omnitrophota bacterium]
MPRTRRIIPQQEAALHIICRGNNKQQVFHQDADKVYYYALLRDLKKDNHISIYHYCLMDNHVHLIVWLSQESTLSRFMKQLSLSFYSYNKKVYGYAGHLWQGRFKSIIIDLDAHLLQCGKYIELNPVRAGIVDRPERYPFSSYCHYAYGKPDAILIDNPVYTGFSVSEENKRKQYVEFVLDKDIIETAAFSRRLIVGNDFFVREYEARYNMRAESLARGRPRNPEK